MLHWVSLFMTHAVFHILCLLLWCCYLRESIFYVTAVYLVAQYARYEMRRMEAKLEEKKKQEEKKRQEEEEKTKELELKEAEEKVKSNPVILEVKTRLVKLEETVDEIVAESKKQSSGSMTKNQGDTQNKSE
ncbi:hypothetical protein ACOSQ3_004736 [Xanthoceras sorbifolium]